MNHLTYFTWPELHQGDQFRVAGYDDLFQKWNEREARCLGAIGLRKATKLAKRNELVQFGDNAGGLILIIAGRY